MDIDFQSIYRNFVNRFVLEHSRERVLSELKDSGKRSLFTTRLNHDWESVLDMRHIKPLDPKTENLELIKHALNIETHNLCYVISTDHEIDDKVMEIDYTLSKIYGSGLGSIIVNLRADHLYLETGMESAAPNRFIGKIKN